MHKQAINDINICSDFEVCTGGDDKRGSAIHVAEELKEAWSESYDHLVAAIKAEM